MPLATTWAELFEDRVSTRVVVPRPETHTYTYIYINIYIYIYIYIYINNKYT